MIGVGGQRLVPFLAGIALLVSPAMARPVVAAGNCGDEPYTRIFAIQGSASSSPIAGTLVTTEGVITGNFEGPIATGLQGFYIQDPGGDGNTATSDGLFV
ncbi:MAG TPA: hypothetical protein VM093_03185, partial [Aeromicrobium sp.]|nr:hypothetical protein [Aeromicrobium sp.]